MLLMCRGSLCAVAPKCNIYLCLWSVCSWTERSKAVDVHWTTHPLFSQLLFQWCQAAFLSQHAAVPPADRRIHTEQLRVAVNRPHDKMSRSNKPGWANIKEERPNTGKQATVEDKVKERSIICALKRWGWYWWTWPRKIKERNPFNKSFKLNWYLKVHSH